MASRLPHSALAVVDIAKVRDYCLSPSHSSGRHKARVFREALILTQQDANWLRDALLTAAVTADATPLSSDVWGEQWRIDTQMTRHQKSAMVRSIWIIRTGEYHPRLVSCWVL